MPTKSEIEGRVSRIYQIFKSVMPAISVPYPAVTVATQRTYRDARALFAARIGASAAGTADEHPVELLTGSKGSAIIIRKEHIRNQGKKLLTFRRICLNISFDEFV